MTREPRTSTGQWFWRGNAVKGSEAQLARTLCAIEDEAQSMRWPAASPSRDTEIERIAAVLRRANWPIDGHGRYGAVPSGQVKDAASRLYSAGLRSQPASEPSLDVCPTMGANCPYEHVFAHERPPVLAVNLALSQPADNEAAE